MKEIDFNLKLKYNARCVLISPCQLDVSFVMKFKLNSNHVPCIYMLIIEFHRLSFCMIWKNFACYWLKVENLFLLSTTWKREEAVDKPNNEPPLISLVLASKVCPSIDKSSSSRLNLSELWFFYTFFTLTFLCKGWKWRRLMDVVSNKIFPITYRRERVIIA